MNFKKIIIAALCLFIQLAVNATPKISVIIPVYNSEKFLEECLDSVINQTFKDIEIICVNDGSKDNSLSILQKYAKKDKRIRVFSQKNAGASAARNVGLDNANGEYIAFVDSDDTIKPTMLEKLYNIAMEYQCDISMCDFSIDGNSGSLDAKQQILVINGYPNRPVRSMLYLVCWNKIYRKSTIGNLRFDKKLIIIQDEHFNLLMFSKINKIAYLPEKLYNYKTTNSESITRTKAFSTEFKLNESDVVIRDLYDKLRTIPIEQAKLRNNVLNDIALNDIALKKAFNGLSFLTATQKFYELYRDGIIDLNMDLDCKIYAIVAIIIGKIVSFVKGITNAR